MAKKGEIGPRFPCAPKHPFSSFPILKKGGFL
jgi:hypothetical protein